jgi:hypothetical protein
VAATKNKWPGDWASYLFYHKVPLDQTSKSHPLVAKKIGTLGEMPKLDVDRVPANEGYLAVLHEVSKHFGMYDIIEEFVACGCFPMKVGWSISLWAPAEKHAFALAMPDFAEAFQLHKECKHFF